MFQQIHRILKIQDSEKKPSVRLHFLNIINICNTAAWDTNSVQRSLTSKYIYIIKSDSNEKSELKEIESFYIGASVNLQ